MKSPPVEPGMRLLVAVLTLLQLVCGVHLARAQPAPEPPAAPAPPPEVDEPAPAAPAPNDPPAPTEPLVPPPEAPAAAAPQEAPGAPPAPPERPRPPASDGASAAAADPKADVTPTTSADAAESAALRYTLQHIVVRGNLRTNERVVLRYLPFKEGALIDVDNPEIRLARFRLLGTGFFKDVQFSLEKGSNRGMVVLVVDVIERNTIVLNDVWMGVAADADNEGNSRPLSAYAGIDVAETNLLGTGVTLGGAMAYAEEQLALRAHFLDPGFAGSPWMTSATFLYNRAQDYFGNAQVHYSDPESDERTDHAVVEYKRLGGALGVGRDLSTVLQFWMHYRLEGVDASYPLQASHVRGQDNIEPIDFDIIRGQSFLSTLRATLQLDTRDHPFLPTAGWFLSATGELGMPWLGSDYTYQRADIQASHWWQLPWEHVVRLQLFGGAISGEAPFFEQYYVGDFTDFLPARILGVNFDRRPPPNFLGTQIVEVRYGEFAAKIGGEYRLPLYRGHRSIFGIDLFGSGGIYSVFGNREMQSPAPGYEGWRQIPIDITANLGFRMDTAAGGFTFAFSNILYFIPVETEGPAGDE